MKTLLLITLLLTSTAHANKQTIAFGDGRGKIKIGISSVCIDGYMFAIAARRASSNLVQIRTGHDTFMQCAHPIEPKKSNSYFD